MSQYQQTLELKKATSVLFVDRLADTFSLVDVSVPMVCKSTSSSNPALAAPIAYQSFEIVFDKMCKAFFM